MGNMNRSFALQRQTIEGVSIHIGATGELATRRQIQAFLDEAELSAHVSLHQTLGATGAILRIRLIAEAAASWAPNHDTLGLCRALDLSPQQHPEHLTREIVLSLLMSPLPVEFPSVAEFMAAVRIRHNIVLAARKTSLAFRTSEAERPADYWTYVSGRGFILLPGASLIEGLEKATQPGISGTQYSFSCYRASEYVCLLGLCQELAYSNPALLEQLENLWRARAIQSGEFHEVFLRELGSMAEPLPPRYYVPGDRVWFRNPDSHSSDASGFEGSWVFYLGEGLFCNFWNSLQPFTLDTKCLEIYHWRNATWQDENGDLRIDEDRVARLVSASREDAVESVRIMVQMQRYRDPSGVYLDGGCLDTTREFPRWICPGTADLRLPED